MIYQIYVLTDPQGEVRYVGQTIKTLHQRLVVHCQSSNLIEPNHKNNWIKSLLIKGESPEIFLLQLASSKDELDAMERYYIKFFREERYKLTNATDGGDGVLGYRHSPEIRAKISASKTGTDQMRKPLSTEHKAKLSAIGKGKKHSEERKAKIAIALTGRLLSEEHKAKLSTANKIYRQVGHLNFQRRPD